MYLNYFSAILAGFSIVSSLVLLFAYLFFLPDMRKSATSKFACTLVLLGLASLQCFHFSFFINATDVLSLRSYNLALMILPIAFFYFARAVLFPDSRIKAIDALHLAPLLLALFLPLKAIPTIAFVCGSAYTLWFARSVYKLRDQRGRFKFEMFFFSLFALMAVVALFLGLLLPAMQTDIFYIAYSNSISASLVLIVAALLIFPELLSDISMLVELGYAQTKLGGISTEQKASELEQLMLNDKHYENEQLNLSMVADLLSMSSHQLSELINTEYGYGFPRYVREHRVRAAKYLLINEPKSTVLAVSMATGFKSQSGFYAAFKDATGESPAAYRSTRLRQGPSDS